MYVDRRTSITTTKQWEALARLRNGSQGNVQIMLTEGTQHSQEYAAVGRQIRSDIKGILHGNVLRVGQYLIHGSANWTTSSASNQELCTLTKLQASGVAAFEEFTARLQQNSRSMQDYDLERHSYELGRSAARQQASPLAKPD